MSNISNSMPNSQNGNNLSTLNQDYNYHVNHKKGSVNVIQLSNNIQNLQLHPNLRLLNDSMPQIDEYPSTIRQQKPETTNNILEDNQIQKYNNYLKGSSNIDQQKDDKQIYLFDEEY